MNVTFDGRSHHKNGEGAWHPIGESEVEGRGRWWERPETFRMLCRIAAVMEYVEAEFGIQDDAEREKLHLFVRDLHSAFGRHLDRGVNLEDISFPPEVLADYESDFHGFPSAIVVEKLRKQFHDY